MHTELIPQSFIKDFSQQDVLYRFAKRSFDIIFALFLILLLLPLLILIALLIKLESKGPIIYSQNRVGSKRVRASDQLYWQLEPFKMHKFRSMFTGSDTATHRNYSTYMRLYFLLQNGYRLWAIRRRKQPAFLL